MSTTMKKTNTRNTATKTTTTPKTTTKVEVKAKKFNPTDEILCRSVTSGEYLMHGAKSDEIYKFADYGAEEYIEYQDLAYAIRSKHTSIMMPRILILDEDVIAEYKVLEEVYNTYFDLSSMHEILELSPAQIKEVVAKLPIGAKDALKGIVATAIDNGSFDSMNKIKVLDELFGTQMALTLMD